MSSRSIRGSQYFGKVKILAPGKKQKRYEYQTNPEYSHTVIKKPDFEKECAFEKL